MTTFLVISDKATQLFYAITFEYAHCTASKKCINGSVIFGDKIFLLVNVCQQGEEESRHHWSLQDGTTLPKT